MGYTPNLRLVLTPEDDTTTTFKDWRVSINGQDTNSNMEIIDSYYYTLLERVVELEKTVSILEGLNTIAFYVDGEEYTAVSGMTWRQFIDSSYNPDYDCGAHDYDDDYTPKRFDVSPLYPDSVRYHDSYLCNDGTYRITLMDGNDTEVSLDDTIIADYEYGCADQ